ncbi:MAG: DUF6326 family protein [Bacteroidota bacterium]
MRSTNNLEDFKINVKFKLSALWTSLMFCYVYGDFFSLFVPGRIQNLMSGNSGTGSTTPWTLLIYAILLTIPSLMIFLSLALKPKVNRLANIYVGIFFTVVMLLVTVTSISKWMIFYVFLGNIEIIITCLITWHAWKWPKQGDPAE